MAQARTYRNNGAAGALLDEYESALEDLIATLDGLDPDALARVMDPATSDEDCRSIQSVLSHVVQSGYTYALEIRKWLGEGINYREKVTLRTVEAYGSALELMFAFTEQVFLDHPTMVLTEFDPDRRINVRWGQSFDVEQLMQHAIVHVLRHRRQIERFKMEMDRCATKPY